MLRHLLFGSGTGFVLSFASLVFMSRAFALDFISDAKAAAIFGSWFAVVFSAQAHTAFLYFNGRADVQSKVLQIFTLSYLLIACVACGFVFWAAFPHLYQPVGLSSWGLIGFSVVTGMNLLFTVSPAVFTAQGASQQVPLFVLSYSMATFCSLLLASLLSWSVNSYAVTLALLSLVAIGLSEWRKYVTFVYHHIRAFPRSYHSPFGRYAGRMSLALFFETLGERLDKMLASRVLGAAAFAKYSVLCFENPLVNLLLSSYGIAFVKNYQQGAARDRSAFLAAWTSMIRKVTVVTFPVSTFLIANHVWFVSTVFGDRFSDTAGVFQIYLAVTMVRFAPFQALLRMEGLAHFNAVISFFYFVGALGMAAIVVLAGLNLLFLALSYMTAWVVFNALAIYFFSRETGLGWWQLLAPTVWSTRIAQCLLAGGMAALVPSDDIHWRLVTFCLTYLAALLVEPVTRDSFVGYARAAWVARKRA